MAREPKAKTRIEKILRGDNIPPIEDIDFWVKAWTDAMKAAVSDLWVLEDRVGNYLPESTSADVGKVLTVDDNGNTASWQTPQGGGNIIDFDSLLESASIADIYNQIETACVNAEQYGSASTYVSNIPIRENSQYNNILSCISNYFAGQNVLVKLLGNYYTITSATSDNIYLKFNVGYIQYANETLSSYSKLSLIFSFKKTTSNLTVFIHDETFYSTSV